MPNGDKEDHDYNFFDMNEEISINNNPMNRSNQINSSRLVS